MDESHAPAGVAQKAGTHRAGRRLGPFLCWAVVFADIGTSVYYVPGILYGQVGRLAGFFVCLTLLVFMLLTLKYAEVTARFPEGGGVVTVASRAMGPWFGALGGMLILVDYFLTAALSSLSGVIYFQVVVPAMGPAVLLLTVGVLGLLGLLNWWGIKESATLSAVAATIAFVGDLLVLGAVFTHVPLPTILHVFREIFTSRRLTGQTLLFGYAGAFLAFSGLESISQLSPVMRVPRKRVAGLALALVVITVGITSPLLTIFSTTLVCQNAAVQGGALTCIHAGKAVDPNQFISILGGIYGGPWLGVAVAISAAALLIFASNTAIIGAYHVFMALARMNFFPPIVTTYNKLRGTPHVAIGLATGIPVLVLVAVHGAVDLLGDMYAFGLLGAFSLTCLGLDIVRWRERHGATYIGPSHQEEEREEREQVEADQAQAAHREMLTALLDRLGVATGALDLSRAGPAAVQALEPLKTTLRAVRPAFQSARSALAPVRSLGRRLLPDIVYWLGFLTTAAVMLAWGANIYHKVLATEFGGGVTLAGLAVAGIYRWQQERAGKPAVYPMHALYPIPRSLLVLLPPGAGHAAEAARDAVARVACESAAGRPIIFLYVSPTWPAEGPPRFMGIHDPYGFDKVAQHAFVRASSIAARYGITGRQRYFVYRVGGPAQVGAIWRIIRPSELITIADKRLAHEVQPDYVRFQDVNGVRVAHYVRRPAGFTNGGAGSSGPAITAPARPAHIGAPQARQRSGEPRSEPTTQPRKGLDAVAPAEAFEEAEQYVWTGTELKRVDEVNQEHQEQTPPDADAPSTPTRRS